MFVILHYWSGVLYPQVLVCLSLGTPLDCYFPMGQFTDKTNTWTLFPLSDVKEGKFPYRPHPCPALSPLVPSPCACKPASNGPLNKPQLLNSGNTSRRGLSQIWDGNNCHRRSRTWRVTGFRHLSEHGTRKASSNNIFILLISFSPLTVAFYLHFSSRKRQIETAEAGKKQLVC